MAGTAPPWVHRRGFDAMIPASKSILLMKQQSLFQTAFSAFFRPFSYILEQICQNQVLGFLKSGFSKGHLSFIASDNKVLMSIKGKEKGCDDEVIVKVKNPWFWVRVAFESDLGM